MPIRRPTPIAPLIVLRVVFGALLFISTIRFMAKGWIYGFYTVPQFHFSYVDWARPLPEVGLWIVFTVMAVCALCITAGLFYRATITTFFLLFTYIELLDKSYYLNHYYFVSVFTFILIWLPLNGAFSLDNRLKIAPRLTHVPVWMVWSVRFMLGIVYVYAGIAKINSDWLLRAQPLQIWLRARVGVPLIGRLFHYTAVAYAMSWVGMLFDLTIPFWLTWKRSRGVAYCIVILFHLMTAVLFNIGMFPWMMIGCTLVFFQFKNSKVTDEQRRMCHFATLPLCIVTVILIAQLLIPWRHLLHAGNVNWNEAGFRFSWRVMLVEKTAEAVFYVTNPETGKTSVVLPRDYLTPIQAKQMAFQPDMIVQFAQFIDEMDTADLVVTADVVVSWNGRRSRLLIDPTIDLTD